MNVKSYLDDMFSKTYFEPTISSFKNALLINYKKVGTRWIGMVSSSPNDYNKDKLQLDLSFSTGPYNVTQFEDYNTKIESHSKLTTSIGDVYVRTFFDIQELDKLLGNPPHLDNSGYNKFNSTPSFFEYEGVNSWNELLFENPHKDIIFLIRNPFERYISGCTQLLYHMIDDIPNSEEMRNELKFYVNLTDSELKNLYKFLRTDDFVENMNFENLNYTAVKKVLKYIVDKRTDLIFQDIHTQNYLKNYIDLIHDIKDKSKIKIIDLSQCSGNKAIKFFDELRGDAEITKNREDLLKYRESNKPIYQFFINQFIDGSMDFINTSSRFYTEPEYIMYLQLLNTPYFVDLGD